MLRPELLHIIRCPQCGGELRAAPAGAQCPPCGAAYAIRNAILDLNPEPSPEAASEMAAHMALEDLWNQNVAQGPLQDLITGENGLRALLAMPYCPFPELVAAVPDIQRVHELGDDFFALLDRMALKGDETVVELGSHLAWSAWRLAERAGTVVATDISHQLAVAQVFVDHGPYFDRVFCDMHTLPFGQDSCDLVFGVAVVHHSGDLVRLFQRVQDVLKPGGSAVFFAEPVAGRWDTAAKETFGAAEKEFGVQEHVYTINEYFSAARAAGLRPRVEPLPGILREEQRKWKVLRRIWLALLRSGMGYHGVFTRWVYPKMLEHYPRIPFPRFALILEN